MAQEYPLIKVQEKDAHRGWVDCTRCAPGNEWIMLLGYRRDYPSREHRLIRVHHNGSREVIRDDPDELDTARLMMELGHDS